MKEFKQLIEEEDLKHKIELGYSLDVSSLLSQMLAHYKKMFFLKEKIN